MIDPLIAFKIFNNFGIKKLIFFVIIGAGIYFGYEKYGNQIASNQKLNQLKQKGESVKNIIK